MADDPRTKQDRPSEGAAAPEEKVAQEAAEAKAAATQEQTEAAADTGAVEAPEAEPKPAPRQPRARTAKPRQAKPAEPAKAETPAPKSRAARPPGTRPVVRAQARYVRTSARKARLVCDHIRGRTVTDARAILANAPRAVAQDWRKLLESAVANAENNHELVGDELRILSVYADEGPTLKRFRPRAMGRATRIRRRTSHLTIMLTPKE